MYYYFDDWHGWWGEKDTLWWLRWCGWSRGVFVGTGDSRDIVWILEYPSDEYIDEVWNSS